MRIPFLSRKASIKNESLFGNTIRYLRDWFRGEESDSGVRVTHFTALENPTVYRCVSLIAGDIGRLPCDIFRRTPDGAVKDPNHPAYNLVRYRANAIMSAGTFRETLQAHALLHSAGRAGILRDARSRPTALIPFLPDRSFSVIEDGELFHVTRIGNDGQYRTFFDRDVLFIRGLSPDGILGYDTTQLARNSIGLAQGAREYASRLYKNQARPSIVLESPDRFTLEAATALLDDWERHNAGLQNAGRPALSHSGVTAKTLAMSSNDAQTVESRELERVELCQFYGVPPHMAGASDNVGYNSVEALGSEYLNSTLSRWQVKWEDEIREKLLTEQQKTADSHYAEFDSSELLKADLMTRYRAYQIGIQSEFLSPNEARGYENLPKRDGGDEFRNPNTTSNTNSAPDKSDKAIESRLAAMLRVEINRVTQAAGKKEFAGWLVSFYQRWSDTLGDVIEELGGARALAEQYCSASQNALEGILSQSPDRIADRVKRLTRQWPARIATLADAISKEQACYES